MNIIYYISAIIFFSIFDVIGHYHILTKKGTVKPKRKHLIIYRILQGLVQAGIIALLWFVVADFWTALWFMLSWWFGVCDSLYYVFSWQWKMFTYEDHMEWLWWTPYGIIADRSDEIITGPVLLIFSIFILSISLIAL